MKIGELVLATNDNSTLPNSLAELLSHFYGRIQDLGEFHSCAATELSPAAAKLLNHNRHMTESVESFYGSPVNVEVIRTLEEGANYAREILLRRQSDNEVVQYGVVWLARQSLPPDVMREIEAEDQPLGRVLIEAQVMREVTLNELFDVRLGPALACFFRGVPGEATFGRTAIIHCQGEPTIFLLEVLAHRPLQGAGAG